MSLVSVESVLVVSVVAEEQSASAETLHSRHPCPATSTVYLPAFKQPYCVLNSAPPYPGKRPAGITDPYCLPRPGMYQNTPHPPLSPHDTGYTHCAINAPTAPTVPELVRSKQWCVKSRLAAKCLRLWTVDGDVGLDCTGSCSVNLLCRMLKISSTCSGHNLLRQGDTPAW